MINEIDDYDLKETLDMLKNLVINYSDKTRFIAVPSYQTSYTITEVDRDDNLVRVTIPLVNFLGRYIGYDPRLDIVVVQQEKDR